MDKDNQSTLGQAACGCPSSETMLQSLEQEREYALARVERITKAIRCLKDNPQAAEAYKIIVSGLHGGY